MTLLIKKRTIIGLELSGGIIRWVRGESGPPLRVTGCGEEDAAPTGTAEALRRLAERERFARAVVVVSIPRHEVFLRKVTMPPGTEKETRSMLAFEAEKYVPFPLDDAAIDFYPISAGAPNDIMMVVVRNEVVRKHGAALGRAGIFPSVIAVSSIALDLLLRRVRSLKDATFALVSVNEAGWETGFFFRGQMILSRGFARQPWEDPSATAAKIVREIGASEVSFRTMCPGQETIKVYLAGGGDDLSGDLERAGMERFDRATEIDGLELPLSVTAEQSGRLLTALGLALSSGSGINVIPEDMARAARSPQTRKTRITAAAAAALVFMGAAAFYYGKHRTLIEGNRALAAKVNARRSELPALERQARRLEAIDRFSAGSLIPLELLRELSSLLPANAYISQMSYDGGQKTLTIKGRTSSFGSASVIAQRMAKSGCFARVASKGARAVNFEGRSLVDFEIQCIAAGKGEE